MKRFIVVPKVHHGRHTSWEVIDTDAGKTYRARLGFVDDQHAAESVARILNDHRADYTTALAALDNDVKF